MKQSKQGMFSASTLQVGALTLNNSANVRMASTTYASVRPCSLRTRLVSFLL